MSTPLVFDRPLVRRRLSRALRQGYADFLLNRVVEDMEERLSTVLRPFSLALDAHGKSVSSALLDLDVPERPQAWGEAPID